MTDVNGTRHHLLLGRKDWEQCMSPGGSPNWLYDADEYVTLAPQVFEFPQPPGDAVLTIDARRGAAMDRYGHWYWISDDQRSIRVRWSGGAAADHYWTATDVLSCDPPHAGEFVSKKSSAPPSPEPLAGLAVTAGHYLVVGSPTTGALLVFDLHTGGAPVRVPLPPPPHSRPGTTTIPFDMASLPDGGVLILDRIHKNVWRLDATLCPAPPPAPGAPDALLFQPHVGPRRAALPPGQPQPIAISDATRPVGISPLPDGSLLILDQADPGFATVRRYSPKGTPALASVPLVETALRKGGDPPLNLDRILAHDMAFVPHADDKQSAGILHLASAGGNQAFALHVQLANGLTLRAARRYFPLRSYTGKALVAPPGFRHPFFDQGERWLPVMSLGRPRYAPTAKLDLPVLDGKEPGCVWHRLCLDACLPPETAVRILTRTADDAAELDWQAWQEEPQPYHRAGPEIPYYSLWRQAEQDQPHTGTWETLFQNARGRYLAIRLELSGNGRTTPKIRALRAHYPRFSYLENYLPAVYQEDAQSGHLLDRFLANPEGLLTTLEGLIADAQANWDVRTTPPETLGWLAGWIGLALDPAWTDYQRRLLIAHAPEFYRRRGTVTGLVQAIRLAIEPQVGPAIFQGEYDDHSRRDTFVRVVERYRTRRFPGAAAGDPSDDGGDPPDAGGDLPDAATPAPSADSLAVARERAHRFTVLLPARLCPGGRGERDANRDAGYVGLVERVVGAEKPAHTYFTVKRYWAMFRVGEVRLGLDTQLGEGGRFELFRLGDTALAEGALGAAYPSSLTDRTVLIT